VATLNEPKEWVECMAYSPSGEKLGVGSHDNNIYLYNCPDYTFYGKLEGHSSFITSFDWSLDSELIRSVSGDYFLNFWNINA